MKTTVELSDELLHRAKQHAASQGTTLRSILEQALQRWLDEFERDPSGYVLPDGRFRGAGPTVDQLDWDQIREDIDRERVFGT